MALPDRTQSRAILIGTSTYQDQRLTDLPSVSNNLTDLYTTLTAENNGSFSAENCTLVENPTDDRQVLRKLADIAAQAVDVLLVYYAGHGVVGGRQHELYFGLNTTDLDRPQYSALSWAWMRDELLESRATTKVLILDCCFSGRAIDEFMADEQSLIMGAIGVSGTYTLTSSPANVPSLAPKGARHTAFSGELINLLREGIPDGPAELDLHLIYQQLNRRMAAHGWPTPKQRGTDNAHGLALAYNSEHFATRFRASLTDARNLVDTNTEEAVDLLRSLLANETKLLHTQHPLLAETRFELDSTLALLSRNTQEKVRQSASPSSVTSATNRSDNRDSAVRQSTAEDVGVKDVEQQQNIDRPNVSGAANALGAFVLLGIPLWLLGDAAKQVTILASGHSLGFSNYSGLVFWIAILGFICAAGTWGIVRETANAAGRAIGIIAVVAPFLLGFLFGGHYWWWIDGMATGIAHLFIFRF